MKAPKLFKNKMQSLNDHPKSAPVDQWNKPPDPRPQITIDSNQLKDIAEWKVGETYTVGMKIKMISTRLEDVSSGDRHIANFVITHIGVDADDESDEIEKDNM